MRGQLASIIILLTLIRCTSNKEYTPQKKKFVEAVYASGKILPFNDHKIFSKSDGVIIYQYVSEGDSITPGQPILKIENVNQDARYTNTLSIYEKAQSNLKETSPILTELQNQLKNAGSRLINDSVNFQRLKSLMAENIGTKSELDKSELIYKLSANEYSSAKKRYQKTKDQLYIEFQNASAQYKIAQFDLKGTVLNADIQGKIYELYRKSGESVRRGDPIALLGDHHQMYIQLYIDEMDITKVKPGQRIILELDMYKGKKISARVKKIYPSMNPETQSIKVDALFEEAAPWLVANASVEANIIIQEKENVLGIPTTLLMKGDSVWIKTDNDRKKVKITKGIESSDFVEVTSGLDSTDILYESNESE